MAMGLDREQWHGVVALTGVSVGLASAVVALLRDSLDAQACIVGPVIVYLRDRLDARLVVLVPLALLVLAVAAASTNWRPASLRVTGAIAIALVLAVVASVGRNVRLLEPTDNAAAELVALDRAIDALDAPAATAATELASTLEAKLARLDAAIASARASTQSDPTLVDAAVKLRDEAQNSDRDGVTRAAAEFTNNSPADPAPVLVALAGAVDGVTTAFDASLAPPTRTSVDGAVAEACRAINAAAPDDPCDLASSVGGAVTEEVPVALALVRLRLAEYRQAVLARDEDAKAVEDAATALADTQATSPSAEVRTIGVLEAVRVGANHVLTGANRMPTSGLASTIEPAMWVLLAVLAAGFWRWVERRSARQLPGPVKVELTPFKGSGTDTSDEQKVAFRTAVLRNLAEPSAMPGATALQSLSDLVEIAGPASGSLGKLFAALRSAVQAPVGYGIAGEVVPPADASTGPWTVLVHVTDLAGRRNETVATVSGATAPSACRAAGYWAASTVIERCARLPGWTRWSAASSTALAAFDDTGRVGGVAPSTSDLAAAAARAPASGVLLHRWADACDLDGNHLEALSLYARAVAAHPRFPAARYRLAVAVSMLARSPESWLESGASERRRIAGQLDRACSAMGLGDDALHGARLLATAQGVEPQLGTLAEELFAQLRRDTNARSVLARALRASERDYFWPPGRAKLGPEGTWSRRAWLVRAAALGAANHRPSKKALEEVRRRAERPGSFWQLSYNLACYYATTGANDTALTWLERALERPEAGQMAGGWLGVDPDLENLRGEPRFQWVVGQVDDSRKVVPDDA